MRTSLVLCLASAGLLLAGCGGSASTGATSQSAPSSATVSTQAAATVTRTVTTAAPPTAITTASTSAATAPSGGAAASPAGGTGACTPRDLGIHRGRALGAAGTAYVEFDFVNVSSSSCTLEGYPGVSLVLTSGAVDDIPNYRSPAQAPHRVTVAPGARTPFIVGIHSNAAHPCVMAGHFRFIPPGQTTYEQIAYSAQVCGDSVTVEPVGYGNGG